VNQRGQTRRLNILVADDHPTNRKVMEIMLSKQAEVVLVENGQEAVAAALAETFDIILMDMQMPVMDGIRATRQIRIDEVETQRPHVPILMLAAHSMDDHIEMGREAGADGHLNKPVSMAQLQAVIETMTGTRGD